MKIKNYLEKLKNCPDNKLSKACKIGDNFDIFVKGNLNGLENELKYSDKFTLRKDGHSSFKSKFNHIGGVVIASLSEGLTGFSNEVLDYVEKEYSLDKKFGFMEFWRNIGERYDFRIQINPYQEPRILYGEETRRPLANCLRDLSEILIEKNYSFCLPQTFEDKGNSPNIEDRDYSSVVIHKSNIIFNNSSNAI